MAAKERVGRDKAQVDAKAGGAAAGGTAGAVIGGMIGGPVGAGVGAVAGAAAGGLVGNALDYKEVEPEFRKHFESGGHPAVTSWDDAAPAYRYGFERAGREEYCGRSFEDVRSDLKSHWRHKGHFDDMEPLIRTGWERRASGAAAGRGGDTIQVKEERLHAEKQPVEAGEVRVRKDVRTETKHLDVPVQREEVVIERTPVHGRAATEAIREGEEVRIPVREEKVDVRKEAVVTEEVKVGKRAVQDTEHVTGQVRKEEVKVEKKGDVDVRTRGTGKGSK